MLGLGRSLKHAAWLPAVAALCTPCLGATTLGHYYGHDTVHDSHGVIAPWYTGLNGQCDFRVRIAAETLKRYPWTTPEKAVTEVPEYVFNPGWRISADGVITPLPMGPADGDLGCRAWVVLMSLMHYYRYSGDPAAIAHMTYTADVLLDYCLTPADHPWPRFLISAPFRGVSYGQADPRGYIQLDFTANCGIGLIKAYQLTGRQRYLDAAKHWADLLAQKRNTAPGADPWGRYANPQDVPWGGNNKLTGGVASFVLLFDELIRLGYTGTDNQIVEARDAALAYIRDKLLPAWTVDDTWGRSYNDWEDPVQAGNVSEAVSWVMMAHRDYFPNWKSDVRNILSLFMHRTSVDASSRGDVYSGSWAYPESSSCCGPSLWYATLEVAGTFGQYGVEADSEWGRELARRQEIHSTYDIHESGVTEDAIDGGCIVNDAWFKIAVPEALWFVLSTMSWLPEELGANRENHIMRTTGTVTSVIYSKGKVSYSTFDAPANSVEVLRLAFRPEAVTANGAPLRAGSDLSTNGYTVKALTNGDCIVSVRHDGSTRIVVSGSDPQAQVDSSAVTCSGVWTVSSDTEDYQGSSRVCSTSGGWASYTFGGNQVRVIGRADTMGGLADVYVDGVKQLVPIDCYSPVAAHQQVLYYKNGLGAGNHTVKVVVRGAKNPRSAGTKVYIDAVQYSAATGDAGYGSGGGPTDAQRWILGYPGRPDYVDSKGNVWRPATEWICRLGAGADIVARTWWTDPVSATIDNTPDPELYRYGAHARDFTLNFTVGPGTYHARLKFVVTSRTADAAPFSIYINGQPAVTKMDVAATAGSLNRAVDLVFNDLTPRNGIIDFRFVGGSSEEPAGEAFLQAIEVGPGSDPQGDGAVPVVLPAGLNLLENAGFEEGVSAGAGTTGAQATEHGWTYAFHGPGQTSVHAESSYGADTAVGQSEYRTGNEALRVSADGGAHSEVFQDVPVFPNADYFAGGWVRPRDLDGQGFGQSYSDSAGIVLSELDSSGNIVAQYPKSATSSAGPFAFLSKKLHTSASTALLRFSLDTVIGCTPEHGSVTYDSCVVDGPAPPGTLKGAVTSGGSPLAGVTVTLNDRSAVTGADGSYLLADVPRGPACAVITAVKTGYYTESRCQKLHRMITELDIELVRLPENNLLANPGWEDGAPKGGPWEGSGGRGGTGFGWTYSFPSSNTSYFEAESDYLWRQRYIHGGREAIAATVTSNGQCVLSQTVDVSPNAAYTASVWAKALDWDGLGFGRSATDSAGLLIKELDFSGSLVHQHNKVALTHATEYYELLSISFTTRPNTAKVVYVLDSVIACGWQHGGVIYDDAALDGPAPGVARGTVTGTVRSGGNLLGGVTVTVAGRSATTGLDGGYLVSDVPIRPGYTAVTASKPGYFTENKYRVLQAAGTVVHFDIISLPLTNLLANPGWELGAPRGWPWAGSSGSTGSGYGWTYAFPNSGYSYFEAESDYLWRQRYYHSGDEAIAATTDGSGQCVLSQTVEVWPSAEYKAAVWVLGLDLDGQGFGAYPTDTAYLRIHELDSSGRATSNRAAVIARQASADFLHASMSFVTRPETAKARYILDTVIGGRFSHGGVIYDDSVLEGPLTLDRIGEAKAMPDGSVVRLVAKRVSAVYADRFYVEEDEPIAGIAVLTDSGIAVGDVVNIIGKLFTTDGERVLAATSVIDSRPAGSSQSASRSLVTEF